MPRLPRRPRAGRLAQRVLVTLGALAGVLLFYATVVEPRLLLDEQRVEVTLPGLGAEWAGTEVAVFSDLQVGMWLANTGMAERVANRVADADPAAVLLPGDFLYSSQPDIDVQVQQVLDLLAPITDAGIPTYAVVGNHDHAVGAADHLTRAFAAAGIEMLHNEAAVVPRPHRAVGDDLYVVGLGPVGPGLADAEEALREVPDDAARIVMMHNPTAFPQLPAGGAPFAVAGHTHCGQIVIPGAPWSYVGLSAEEARVAEGFAPPGYGEPGNRMYVTCGIGFSLLPARFNAPPQLLWLELQPG